jgi:hypothetical protein
MRDVLIAHLDGAKQVIVHKLSGHEAFKARLWRGAVATAIIRRWIQAVCIDEDGTISYGATLRPTHTIITEHGRAVLARVLADAADAIARAQLNDPDLVVYSPPPKAPTPREVRFVGFAIRQALAEEKPKPTQ